MGISGKVSGSGNDDIDENVLGVFGDGERLDGNHSLSGKKTDEACDVDLLRVVCVAIDNRDCKYVGFIPGDFRE